jgi:hypothetical protein
MCTSAIFSQNSTSSKRSDFNYVNVSDGILMDDSSCTHFDADLNATVQLLHVSFHPTQVPTPTPALYQWDLWMYFTDNKTRNGDKAFGLYKIELKADYSIYSNPIPGWFFQHSQFDVHVFAADRDEMFTSSNTTSFSGIVGASSNHSSQCSKAELTIDNNAKVILKPYVVQAYVTNNKLGSK